jgi:hypothetical protein
VTRADELQAAVERALWDYLGDEAAFTSEYPGLAKAFAEIVRLAQREDPRELAATTMVIALSDLVDSVRRIVEL